MNRTQSYPRTIDSGTGEVLTFVGQVEDPERGTVLQLVSHVEPGAGPPMHTHLQQSEQLNVKRGRIAYKIAGGTTQFAEEGETVTFAPGEAHRFWNASDEVLELDGAVWPAGNFEWYITQMFESISSTGKGRPRPFDGAYLSHRYRSEFETVEIPAPVRKAVFPAIVAIGSALGLSRRFADAPAPLAS